MTEFNELAAKAAQMENQGKIKEAAAAWRRAGGFSINDQNRVWCYSRAAFCDSRFSREKAE